MFMMAMWGAITLLVTLVEYLQNWLSARKNINTEVPALKESVEDLRKRFARLETEWERIRREQHAASLEAADEMER
jgi:phage shock protein A